MPDVSAPDVRDVLAKRHRYLEAVLHEPRRKSELEARLDVSRSTVNYAIRELLESGLVDRTPEGFRATQFGRLAYDAYETYDRTLRTQCAAADALAELPPGSLDEATLFDGAEVILPESSALDRPVRRFLEYIDRADRLRGFSPVVLEPYVDVVSERVVEGDLTAEIVLTTAALEVMVSTYPTQFSDVLATDHLTIYETGADLRFGLALLERAGSPDRVGVVVHDDSGICGLVTNDSVAALGWGERLYRRHRDEAERVFVRGRARA